MEFSERVEELQIYVEWSLVATERLLADAMSAMSVALFDRMTARSLHYFVAVYVSREDSVLYLPRDRRSAVTDTLVSSRHRSDESADF